MPDVMARHPDDGQLLRFSDGELNVPEMNQVRAHLAACWQCRTELDQIHGVISDCVRYQKTTEDCFPSPPAPWCDIYRKFAEMDAAPGSVSFLHRVRGAIRSFAVTPRRWAPVTASLLIVSLLFYELRYAPSVQAAELLQKAVAASEVKPAQPRRIEIRSGSKRLTRTVHAARLAQLSGPEPVYAVMEAQFRTAGYDWDDPLSAHAYASWRDRLSEKRDQVTLIRDAQSPVHDCYQIRTTTPAGELSSASLKLTVQDLRPVESTLLFRGSDPVEIRELPVEPPAAAPPVASLTSKSPVTAPSSSPAPERVLPRAPESVSPAEELKVFAALRRLNADLGEPIEVKSSGSHILVSGVGIPPGRRQQLSSGLASLEGVEVQFSDPSGAVPPNIAGSSTVATVNPEVARIQSRIEVELGGRASFEHFADQVLDRNEALLSRAHALRRLAERFPPRVEARLSAGDRAVLAGIRREHAQALWERSVEMEKNLAPVLAAIGAKPGPLSTTLSPVWQQATEELFQQARAGETLLAVILGGAASNSVAPDLPSQVLTSLTLLRAEAEAYRNLTAAAR
ncbi:MAG: hypothetical protein LC126_03145 [Bryobacterales bacterium]|nr:hypothetical protein [Bryobacterales bacterium]